MQTQGVQPLFRHALCGHSGNNSVGQSVLVQEQVFWRLVHYSSDAIGKSLILLISWIVTHFRCTQHWKTAMIERGKSLCIRFIRKSTATLWQWILRHRPKFRLVQVLKKKIKLIFVFSTNSSKSIQQWIMFSWQERLDPERRLLTELQSCPNFCSCARSNQKQKVNWYFTNKKILFLALILTPSTHLKEQTAQKLQQLAEETSLKVVSAHKDDTVNDF